MHAALELTIDQFNARMMRARDIDHRESVESAIRKKWRDVPQHGFEIRSRAVGARRKAQSRRTGNAVIPQSLR